jgi:hypothetical protein
MDLKNLPREAYVRLDLLPNNNISWLNAGRIESGHISAYQIGKEKMRRFGNGQTLSFRVSPAQDVFKAKNVISGVTRPYRFTNLWKSDPDLPLPQWIQLEWKEPEEIKSIEITFPGHLLREYHAYQPFYRDPQCPKGYSIEAYIDNEWTVLVEVKNNYQRNRKHLLPQPVKSSRIRIVIKQTNGDPSAQVYEVRCY